MRDFMERLQRRAHRGGLTIPKQLAGRLEVYYQLLAAWSVKLNLTGMDLREPSDEAFDRLLIEPLAAARHIPPGTTRILDVGSGGGSPAIPFKLVAPHASLTMVESKIRKSVFLREAVRSLNLTEVDVVTARFEELLARPEFHESQDLITIRAVRIEARVLMALQAFLRRGGLLFLFRGPTRGDTAEGASPLLTWRATYPLVESVNSRLVVLEKRQFGQPEPS